MKELQQVMWQLALILTPAAIVYCLLMAAQPWALRAILWAVRCFEHWRDRRDLARLRRQQMEMLQDFVDGEEGLELHAPNYLRASLGRFRGVDPSQIPDHAQSRMWEAVHLWSPYADKPKREHGMIIAGEPPMAMICGECDLKMPALDHGARKCTYCGLLHQVHGGRVYFWRDEAAQ